MKRVSFVVLLSLVVSISEVCVVEAVTCNPMELSPCMAAITYKVREQRPCFCGYLKDPNLKQFVNSPNARKVASTCGVPYPQC
ncbi:hypothetical protein ACOSQ4_026510 [Xanthoceras sorbifolium]